MSRSIFTLALLLPVTAGAWEPTGSVWFLEDMPLEYEISDYEEDSLQPGETFDIIQTAFSRWEATECAQLDTLYIGPTEENTGFRLGDGITRISWDDPDDNHGVGTLAVASWNPDFTNTRIIQGQRYAHTIGGDIVFNDNITWGNEEQTEAGSCSGRHSVTAVGVHEIGHWWGLGHTCEAIDDCSDPLDQSATMFYALGQCENAQAYPNENDIEGITTLYGPSTQIQCSHEINPGDPETVAFGVAPMEVRCTVTERGDENFSVDSASWFFGDGSDEVNGLDASHIYDNPGSYTITTTVNGTSTACGEWDATISRNSYIRVCGVPDIQMDFEHIDGRRFQMLNNTDLTNASCIYRVQWDIFTEEGSLEASLPTWEPEYEFLENGTYRVVLNVGGLAGTAAHEINIKVRNVRGAGYSTCDSLGLAPLMGSMFLALPLVIRRRRS